jgi:hypothetical protein
LAALVAVMPVALTAADGINSGKPLRRELFESTLSIFQDSTGSRRKPESKPQDQPRRQPQGGHDDRLKDDQRRSIKQVPRSVPKLKPQPVPGSVKMRPRH